LKLDQVASSQIWVAGEALIDLVPQGDSRIPVVGGGPANSAKALSRLGYKTSFIGGISADQYGSMIKVELSEVDLSFVNYSPLPTALAIVTLDEKGSASYEFNLEDTATFDFRVDWLPSGSPEVLHIGTLATVIEPGASELFGWASKLDSKIVFDPNIRPSVLEDKERYRDAFEKWAQISDVAKMSDEDLEWLGYSAANQILELGPELLVVTHGASGMTGYTTSGSVSVPGLKVQVVDTVGAGDTVGAVIVEGLIKNGITALAGEKLFEVLSRAAKAAAITCSRVGANPPTLAELE
jgi:fructokinase